MKKAILFLILSGILGLTACKPDQKITEVLDGSKHFYVVFEERPDEPLGKVYSKDFEIGEVVASQLGADNMVVVEIKVPKERTELFRKNVVLYIDDGRLIYDTVGKSDQELESGAKILGFSGKGSLLWFRAKNSIKAFSQEIGAKAEALYEKATRPDAPGQEGDQPGSEAVPEISPRDHGQKTI